MSRMEMVPFPSETANSRRQINLPFPLLVSFRKCSAFPPGSLLTQKIHVRKRTWIKSPCYHPLRILPAFAHTAISLCSSRFIWLPITEEFRRHLLCCNHHAFQRRDSEVIFSHFLLVPGSHHPRLSGTFGKCLLSSSSSFSCCIIKPGFWRCQEQIQFLSSINRRNDCLHTSPIAHKNRSTV